MEWLENPKKIEPKDACPVYLCSSRKNDDNETPCVIYLCGCKLCIINY